MFDDAVVGKGAAAVLAIREFTQLTSWLRIAQVSGAQVRSILAGR